MTGLGSNKLAKMVSLEEALDHITSNQTVVFSMAAAEPKGVLSHLHKRASSLKGVRLYGSNPSQAFPCLVDASLDSHFTANVMFLSQVIRKHQGNNKLHYVPGHLSQWFQNNFSQAQIDVFWGTCSPPDSRGFVSLGTSCVYESECLRKANLVVLEVNPNIPVTFGSTYVSLDEVDWLVESNFPLQTLPKTEASAIEKRIAEHISPLIPNGATLQLGIGGIPDALSSALLEKKELGIHTEMINDSMMELFLKGVIDGSRKSVWPRKIVGSFAFGSQELYAFLDKNPGVELHPASVVNDPVRIGRNHRMISINTAVEVDLTGQVCSESVGHLEISGVGGATDTHLGAQRSEGGRGIIAFSSLNQKGFPKIVSALKQGAKVSISRNDIDTIVTEFGVVQLKGLSISQRVKAMVSIAHPEHRAKLLHDAKEFGYL